MLQFVEVPYEKFFTITVKGKRVSPFRSNYTKNRKSVWMRRSDAKAAIINSYSGTATGEYPYLSQDELQILQLFPEELRQLRSEGIVKLQKALDDTNIWQIRDPARFTEFLLDNAIYIINEYLL